MPLHSFAEYRVKVYNKNNGALVNNYERPNLASVIALLTDIERQNERVTDDTGLPRYTVEVEPI